MEAIKARHERRSVTTIMSKAHGQAVLDRAILITLLESERAARQALEAELAELRGAVKIAIERANDRLSSISTPKMQGDNLAVCLCSFFCDGGEEDGETGWSYSAISGYEETIDAIREHYSSSLARAIRKDSNNEQ